MTWDYTALLERAPMWMAVVDRQANCCDLSAPWRSHLGLASTGDVQLSLAELLAPAEASARDVLLKAVKDQDTIEAMPTRLAGSGPVTGDLWQWPAPPDADAAAFIFVSFSGRQLAKAMNQSIQDLVLDAAGEHTIKQVPVTGPDIMNRTGKAGIIFEQRHDLNDAGSIRVLGCQGLNDFAVMIIPQPRFLYLR